MSVQDNQLKTTDGFFARVSPRLDAVEEVTVSMAAQGSEATGDRRRADPVHHAVGHQQLRRPQLLQPAPLQVEREHVVQQPRRPAESREHHPPAGHARGRPDRHSRSCSTAATRRSSSSTTRSSARPASCRATATSCTRSAQAGTFRYLRRRPDPRGQPARARGGQRARGHVRSDDRPGPRRHPCGDRRHGTGIRPDRPDSFSATPTR